MKDERRRSETRRRALSVAHGWLSAVAAGSAAAERQAADLYEGAVRAGGGVAALDDACPERGECREALAAMLVSRALLVDASDGAAAETAWDLKLPLWHEYCDGGSGWWANARETILLAAPKVVGARGCLGGILALESFLRSQTTSGAGGPVEDLDVAFGPLVSRLEFHPGASEIALGTLAAALTSLKAPSAAHLQDYVEMHVRECLQKLECLRRGATATDAHALKRSMKQWLSGERLTTPSKKRRREAAAAASPLVRAVTLERCEPKALNVDFDGAVDDFVGDGHVVEYVDIPDRRQREALYASCEKKGDPDTVQAVLVNGAGTVKLESRRNADKAHSPKKDDPVRICLKLAHSLLPRDEAPLPFLT